MYVEGGEVALAVGVTAMFLPDTYTLNGVEGQLTGIPRRHVVRCCEILL